MRGKIEPPPILTNRKVPLGSGVYAMGIGGLHSTEANRQVVSDEHYQLIDVDVASQYPSIIRNLGLYPPALGPEFLQVYNTIIDERLEAKKRLAEIDKELRLLQETEAVSLKQEKEEVRVIAEGGKIQANGTFGKLGSPHSVLYKPELVVAVTLTGQLAVLMLIERAEHAYIPVVSANTDGVVFLCPRDLEAKLDDVVKTWERDTGFVIERTLYRALYSSSVNSYVAIRNDGKAKVKGPLANPWAEGDRRGQMMKNPQMTIISEAIIAYLQHGTPLRATIDACEDPRKIVTVVRVSSGAYWRRHYLGKTIRFYWSVNGSPILTQRGGRVSRTEGARPMAELPEKMPPDVDRQRYYLEAAELLMDMGVSLQC